MLVLMLSRLNISNLNSLSPIKGAFLRISKLSGPTLELASSSTTSGSTPSRNSRSWLTYCKSRQ
ncbi:unnamed protein product [Mycena citricolor]|uniref:Uncharacterized protein n=1 Tax=Mycena citricolor TaxID=2018698 RepID=A0AAD2GRV1_9AGAR|nr:unnamed protein product [Mycena citricolor]